MYRLFGYKYSFYYKDFNDIKQTINYISHFTCMTESTYYELHKDITDGVAWVRNGDTLILIINITLKHLDYKIPKQHNKVDKLLTYVNKISREEKIHKIFKYV